MDIRFENRTTFKVSGYAIETQSASNNKDLSQLWSQYKEKLTTLVGDQSNLYGVLWYTKDHKYYYLLGIDNVISDKQSITVEIPTAFFAIATVPEDLTIVEAWTEYFEKELPTLGYVPDNTHGKYFELYQNGVCELWTPVKLAK